MQGSLFKRLYTYQKERFPLLVHLPLIAAFSFSAIGFSRACRNVAGFIDPGDFAACVFTNLALFFMLRVADEHKDRHDDAQYRSYLPVPRGLISLKELRLLAWGLFVAASVLNIVFYSSLLALYILMMAYLALMRYEFFIGSWLKKHQVWYILSHMAIIPLADIYASSYDWRLSGAPAPLGLFLFLLVSYLSGIVLEVGRKIRAREYEEPGVVSYTALWGTRGATIVWVAVLTVNLIAARFAAFVAGFGNSTSVTLALLYIAGIGAALAFLLRQDRKSSRIIELVSLVWALGMYLSLGGIPTLLKLTGLSN